MIYHVEEAGCVTHTVSATNEGQALELVREQLIDIHGESEIENHPDDYSLEVTRPPHDQVLTFDFDGRKISHTVEEWTDIYHGYWATIACSEY